MFYLRHGKRKAHPLGVKTFAGVHSDDFAALINQRPAAVAKVNGRIGLDEVIAIIRTMRRHDAPCNTDGVPQVQRKPQRNHIIAYRDPVGLAERH